MKIIKFLAVFIIALFLIGCSSSNETTIEGSLTNTSQDGEIALDTTYNGKMAYLYDAIDKENALDSAKVVDGRFKLSFNPDSIMTVAIKVEDRFAFVMADYVDMGISLEDPRKNPERYRITGSVLNDDNTTYRKVTRDAENKVARKVRELSKVFDMTKAVYRL